MLFKEIIALYSENRTNINTLCGQNTELLNAKAGGGEIRWVCSTYDGNKKCVQNFIWKKNLMIRT
jgi:hypothetical protein